MKENDHGRAIRHAAKLTANVFDIPGEILTGEPRVTISGAARVDIENHRGLLEYNAESILVNARGMMIKITGEHLTVTAMSDMELVIKGKIGGVEIIE